MAGSNQVGIEVGVKDKASASLKQVAKAFEALDRATNSDGPMVAGDGIAAFTAKLGPAAQIAAKFAETIGADKLGKGFRDLVGEIGEAQGAIGAGGMEAMLTRLGPAATIAGAGISAAVGAVKALATAGALAVGVVGAAATAAFTLAHNSALAADAAFDSSEKVGLSTEAYTRLAFAAKLNAANTEKMSAGIRDMVTRLSTTPKVFEQWGIATRDTRGHLLSTEKVLLNISDRMAGASTAAERNGLAMATMGENGRQLVQMLSLGSEGLRALGVEADRVGATIDATAGIIAGRFNDQLDSTKDTFSAVAREAGSVFQPAITVAMESAQALAARLLGHIGDNREAFEAFATKSVAMLARAFAALTEVGAGLSHVLEGVVSVFTYRFEDAFEGARGAAFEVAKEARHLAVELENGAALTRNQVIPAIEAETTARDNVIGSLGRERQARADLRETAAEAAASAMAAAKAAEGIGSAAGAGAAVVASNLLEQLGRLDALEAALGNVAGAFDGVRQAALENGATISEAILEQATATAAARVEIQGLIADQRTRVREATAAALEMAKIADEQRKKEAEARKKTEAEKDAEDRMKLARLNRELGEESAANKAADDAKKASNAEEKKDIEDTQRTVQGFVSNGLGSLYSEMRGVLSGTQDLGSAIKNLGGSVVESLGQIGIGIAAQKASMALLQALGVTAAAADLGVAKTTAASQINASAATAAAAAFAAYAGIPVVGPALGAAAAATAYAQTAAWVGALAFARGGEVPGVGLRDSVPAMLTPGEYVLPRSVVQDIRIGSPPGPVSGGGGGGGGGGTFHININQVIPATEAQMEQQLRPVLRTLERMGVQRGRRR